MVHAYTPRAIRHTIDAGIRCIEHGQLLQRYGLRSPYQSRIGVVETGVLADLILADGNPLQDFSLIAKLAEKSIVIIKDAKIYKNTLQ